MNKYFFMGLKEFLSSGSSSILHFTVSAQSPATPLYKKNPFLTHFFQ